MTKWEYQVVKIQVGGVDQPNLDQMNSQWLNRHGQAGWELVSVNTLNRDNGRTSDVAFVTFKRPA